MMLGLKREWMPAYASITNFKVRGESLVLFVAIAILITLGVLMTYSSSSIIAHSTFGDSAYFLKRQLRYIALGLVCLFAGTIIPTRLYQKFAYPIYFSSVALLIAVLIPGLGNSAGGAARWLKFGPFSVQPGEAFKFALLVYLSMSLAKKGQRMSIFRIGIIPHFILPGLAMILLLAEPDFGTTFLSASITFSMLFIGGARMTYLFGAIVLALPVLWHLISSSPYRLQRMLAFLDPWAHRQDIGYQVVESLISLGSGGFWGLGLGNGISKLYFLPASHNDFVLSVIGEELGFIGVLVTMSCFVVIAFVGIKTARAQKDTFLTFLAFGLTLALVLQAIINSFVTMGLVPTKGITLPFVSYGGSSLMVCCFMAGILLKLSQQEHTS